MSWCGCGCSETIPSNTCNCNIVWEFATTVDTISSPWDIIVSSPNIKVTSPDSSISVVTNTSVPWTITYEIEKDCCPDLLVAVAPWCNTWGTISDVIKVDTSWPLTRSQNWCDFRELWFDTWSLDNTDELVAAKQWCPAWYLEDVLVTSDPYIDFVTTSCQVRLKTNPEDLFYVDFNTEDASERHSLAPNTSWFQVLDVWNVFYNSTIDSWILEPVYWWVTTYAVRIWRDARYDISMWWSAVVWKWLHTLRTQVRVDTTSWSSYPLLDDRFEWWRYEDQDSNNVINLADLEHVVSWTDEWTTQADWMPASLARWIRWHWFWQSRTLFLNEWDVLTFFSKWNTLTSEWTPAIKYEYWYTARWFDWLTNWSWSWVFRSVAERPLQRITD